MIEQHWSLAEKFIKKWFWLYIFSFIIAPIWYIIKIIVSAELTVEEVWIVYGVISMITLLSSFNDFWLTESLNYFLPKYIWEKNYSKSKTIIIYTLITQIVTSIILAIFLIWGSDFLAKSYFHEQKASDIIFIFAFFFFWNNFLTIISTFFSAIQNTFYQKLVEFIRMWFTLFFTFWIWFFDFWSMQNYSIAWVLWIYVSVIFAFIIFYIKYYIQNLKYEIIIWDRNIFKELFSYALLILLASQASTILSQIDMQMIIYMLWARDAWYYTNYLSIINIPFMVIWPIFAFLFPVISELHSKKEYFQIITIKQIFTKYFVAIAFITNTIFFIFWQTIAYILFGEKFIISWVILQYSIYFLVFNYLLQVNFNILGWTGRVKERVKIISHAIIFNIIANYILIKLMWVVWAAIATWLGWIYIYIMWEKLLKNDYKINYDFGFMIKNIILSFVLCVYSWYLITPFFTWLDRLDSFLYLCIFSFIYLSIFAYYNRSEFSLLLGEVKRIKSWK